MKLQLRTVPGVNEVNTWGGQTREYQVVINPEKLLQYELTLKDVFEALKKNNANFSGGIIEHSSEQYVVRGLGLIDQLEDIKNIVVKYQNSTPIYVRNIAEVKYGYALRQGAATKNGKGEVVTGIVMMLKGENSRNVIKRVKTKMETIKKTLPEGVKIKPFYDQTNLVEQTIKTVETNLIEGGILVVAILLLMLGNIRAALIVASTIPISMMFSFLGMRALGISANIMSLGAIDFGMIVDGSIVMVENTLLKLAHNNANYLTPTEIVKNSLKEMARPIFFGVLIITIVYMPILSLQGMEYKMFSPMVFTVCFALLGSLCVALILVPVLCTFFLKQIKQEKESKIVKFVRIHYTRLFKVALNHRLKTVVIAVSLFVLSIASLPFMGSEFIPRFDEGSFSVGVTNLPSISLTEAVNVTKRIESTMLEVPEVKNVVSKIGRADLATDPMGVYQTDTFVELKPKSKWRMFMTKDKLADILNEKLQEEVPGVNFSFTQPIEMRVNELVSGVKSDIAVKIFGDDLDILLKKAEQVEQILTEVKGAQDIQIEQLTGSKQITVVPNRLEMSKYGISIDDIQNIVSTAIMGEPVSEIIDGRKRFTLRAIFPQGSNLDPSLIQNLLIETIDGRRIPVGQVANISLQDGAESITREEGQRRILVQCNVRGRDIGSFVKDTQKRINSQIKMPSGYYIEFGGQFENQQRAMKRLAIVVPVSILVIFLLLMMTFSSIKHALLVMVNVPFSMIGGVLALWLRGMYLSVPSIVGFIALFGVSILNGLVLITTFNHLQDEGYTMDETLYKGTQRRLRPVLMTAFVATLGFLPMAISTGSGAEVQRPLATVVIGGLITSLFLTLIVLPILYGYICKKN
jgi:cobalt-zinc-cadmium resistance protein CzcA